MRFLTIFQFRDLRQVPDTQEVFLYPHCGISIIVEVLERVDVVSLNDAAKYVIWEHLCTTPLTTWIPHRFHFESLAHDNSAETHKVHEIMMYPSEIDSPTPPPILLYGSQTVPKFNSTVPDQIRILLAMYRLPEKNVDLVMSMNAPMQSVAGDAINEDQWIEAKDAFEVATRSLRILDFGLFV